MSLFNKILVANRGEIAVRIIHSAKKESIRTVSIYTLDDKESLHVKLADEAFLLEGDSLHETYLNQKKIIDLALLCNAEAIHPGYGFLSENTDFAEKVKQAGLVFIGPEPEHIRLMGEKSHALDYVAKLGIPTLESQHGTAAKLVQNIDSYDFPVMVKASSGGGGKGMFICNTKDELPEAFQKAGRQALEYFGNETLFVEKYIPKARHIEVQIAGDTHGNVLHFYERECSVQRRFQKIIEEAPAFISDKLRDEVTTAAVMIARSMNYLGVGTVEFLIDESGNFYFLEMNTRIQVEYPVTEAITGVDLLKLQWLIAAGESLPFKQEDIRISGHSIELRVCAEDPAHHFHPSAGKISHFYFSETENLRIDTFITNGTYISSGYDSLLAKIIIHGSNKKDALKRLRDVVNNSCIVGVKTNLPFLYELLSGDDFQQNNFYTSLVDERLGQINKQIKERKHEINIELPALAYLYSHFFRKKELKSVWEQIGYWRMISDIKVFVDGELVECRLKRNSVNELIQIGDKTFSCPVFSTDGRWMNFEWPQQNVQLYCFEDSNSTYVHHEGFTFALRSNQVLKEAEIIRKEIITEKVFKKLISSDLFGKVLSLNVKPGDKVNEGQALITIESMKSEFHILSPADARVKEIYVDEGNVVQDKQLLIELEPK